ncbi:nuclear transport factor 2 family protein [Acidisoma silvae]|uniref:Nuclear transport factor 2 family protein n=1 Tax=Acidisoma silvae TaxID=2802396 RepID=A0A964E1H6_9PROT|nr:nuclear transport factor 2 family protein [Acidisoma silvae]MCB8878371.1 nuclear transport factor 2 family protein [Acidisoma silvae]
MEIPADTLKSHWTAYAAAYSATDKIERDRLLNQSVSDDVAFTNPGGEGRSRAVLSAHIESFQTSMPGVYFETDRIFVHHGEVLAVWSLFKPDGIKVATGYNFIRPGPDGRFDYMAGFF